AESEGRQGADAESGPERAGVAEAAAIPVAVIGRGPAAAVAAAPTAVTPAPAAVAPAPAAAHGSAVVAREGAVVDVVGIAAREGFAAEVVPAEVGPVDDPQVVADMPDIARGDVA